MLEAQVRQREVYFFYSSYSVTQQMKNNGPDYQNNNSYLAPKTPDKYLSFFFILFYFLFSSENKYIINSSVNKYTLCGQLVIEMGGRVANRGCRDIYFLLYCLME